VLTNRLIKGITALCREFLFDYNDEITLINLKKSLNLYISEYVTNGALTYASINVQRDDDENISVTMNVRYPEMLEVITLTLNID
jgi:hypothetical protein